MSSELKVLFHSPEDMSDAELDVMRMKIQNMRRIPKFAAAFGFAGVGVVQAVFLRQSPTMLAMGAGAVAGYAFGGYGASSSFNQNILKRPIERDVLFAQEDRQLRRCMNLAGYGQNYLGTDSTNLNKKLDKPY